MRLLGLCDMRIHSRLSPRADNMPPSIFGPGIFSVNVGDENVYTFSVNDTNDFNVTIAGGVPVGGVLNDEGNGVYTFIWTPPATPTDGVSFVATDIAGAATVHTPVLRVCACFNGGTCTEEGLLATGAVVQVLTCLCTDGKTSSCISYLSLLLCIIQPTVVLRAVRTGMAVQTSNVLRGLSALTSLLQV